MRIRYTFLLVLTSFQINAQTDIKGKIIEEGTQHPVEFAEITLVTEGHSNLIGVVSNAKGEFKITAKPERYKLQITYVGQVLFSKDLKVKGQPIDLGTIKVKNSQVLKEVFIESKRKLIERKIDRLIFNVENSSKASQGDALEVLRVTPGVRVQNENISMIGKGNLKVLIDDKLIQLSGQDLVNFLRSITSENIKRIEVITTPPAKYEASGNSGLLNIILKKAKNNSWNGQIKTTYIQRRYPTGSVGGDFRYKKDKLTVASTFGYRQMIYYQEQDEVVYFPDGLWHTNSPVKVDIEGLNASLDLNYKISKFWEMGGQYYYNGSIVDAKNPTNTKVIDYESNEILRLVESEGIGYQFPKVHSINYNNEFTLDTLGRKISINMDYFNFNNPDSKKYNGISTIFNPVSSQYFRGINVNARDVENKSAKLDIEFPLNLVDLYFGAKISESESLNNISFFNSGLSDEPVKNLPLKKNDFTYHENLLALYLSANKKFSERWSAQVGLRVEKTKSFSKSNSALFSLKRNYTDFFPTFYLSFNATQFSNFSVNYGRRIQRPSFNELNPNTYFITPFQSVEGNAFLQPAYIDNIELINTYKSFVTKIYYTYEDNLFSQAPLPNATTNVIRFTTRNFINTSRIGFSENYTFDELEWWSSNTSFDINYSKSVINLEEQQLNRKGINARISTYNDIDLNKSKTLLLGINFWYSFPGIDGVFKTKGASSFSPSLQYLLLNKDLNITLSVNDLFRSSAERTTTTINGVYQNSEYYYDSRSMRFSISYRFGNNNIEAKRHETGNEDEKNRAED